MSEAARDIAMREETPADAAGIGHNLPPEPTPFEQSRDEIDGLYMEAKNWLDGSGVQSQADDEAVSRLLDMIRQATKRADERRVEEARPFDEGKAEIQARYNTLIGNTKAAGKGKAVLAADVARQALTPWRQKQDEERRVAAEKARAEAEEARRAALAAREAAAPADLVGREAADALDRAATAAEKSAKRAERPQATGLRPIHRAEVTEPGEFARWAWTNRRAEVEGMFQTLAERLCASGLRDMPGVTIHEERVAR